MRILHVVPAYLPAVRYGGPMFSVHGLCRALAARGHHVEVFTTNIDGPNNSTVPLNDPVLLDGVHVRYFPSNILRRLFWSPPLARALDTDLAGFTVGASAFRLSLADLGSCTLRSDCSHPISDFPKGYVGQGTD